MESTQAWSYLTSRIAHVIDSPEKNSWKLVAIGLLKGTRYFRYSLTPTNGEPMISVITIIIILSTRE